jgi:hypothetical protein
MPYFKAMTSAGFDIAISGGVSVPIKQVIHRILQTMILRLIFLNLT